jgi:hypothetical protein
MQLIKHVSSSAEIVYSNIPGAYRLGSRHFELFAISNGALQLTISNSPTSTCGAIQCSQLVEQASIYVVAIIDLR